MPGCCTSRSLLSKAAQKRAARDKRRDELEALLLTGPLFTEQQFQEISQLSASAIADRVRSDPSVAPLIARIFSLRALMSGRLIHSTTEEFFDEALEAAEKIKEKAGSEPLGPLAGVPLSVKDQINQTGADSTMGLACRVFRPSDSDAPVLAALRDSGVICTVRSNTCQSMMLPEAVNAVYGQSNNPWNILRTPGGSSGGEAALIASGGSVIGIGTDIGGSIRIPAHFSGVVGFKPMPGRVSVEKIGIPTMTTRGGLTAIVQSVGPLARSVDDCSMVMRTWLNSPQLQRADYFVPPLPWRENIYSDRSRKLKIGYYTYDGWFSAMPACERAVREAAEAMKAQGHEVVEWQPPNIPEVVRCYYGIMTGDGARHILEGLEGENILEMYKEVLSASTLPGFLVSMITSLMGCTGEQRAQMILKACKPKSTYEYYKYVGDLEKARKDFMSAWGDLDAVLCPASALPAFPHTASKDLTPAVSYTFVYNAIPLPAGVVPVTQVREDEQTYKCVHNDRFTAFAARVCEKSAGLPIGVQVVTKPWDDELCLRVMKEIEEKIPFTARPPVWKQIDEKVMELVRSKAEKNAVPEIEKDEKKEENAKPIENENREKEKKEETKEEVRTSHILVAEAKSSTEETKPLIEESPVVASSSVEDKSSSSS